MTARTALLAALGATVVALTACGSGDSDVTKTSRQGTALLAAARAEGTVSDAVSFRLQATGSGSSDEYFARRGDDSLVAAEYDAGGRNEVRSVGGVVYVRADLKLPRGQISPWIRIDPGPDQTTWIMVLGDELVAPTPADTSALLAGNVRRVTRLTTGTRRVLQTEPKPVVEGERPSSISVDATNPLIVRRVAALFASGNQIAERRYSKVAWGDDAAPITVPEGAVPIEGVRDEQAAALPAAILRGPAALPAGWSLRAVVGLTVAQGDATCQQVLTLYAPPAPAPVRDGYLAVYLKPTGCPTPKAQGADDFTAGTYRGWVGQDAGATIGGLTVEGVSVRFRSTLPATELATVLATWQPLPA